jgi:hypothetical protein
MPAYKNRPPLDESIELRRYTTLDALVHIFRNRQLRLTRVDKFPDPFEGSVPKKQIDDQLPIFSGRNAAQMMSVASGSVKRTPCFGNWTNGSYAGCAAMCGSSGAGVVTDSCVNSA